MLVALRGRATARDRGARWDGPDLRAGSRGAGADRAEWATGVGGGRERSRSVVVSGDTEALDEVLAACQRDGVWARRPAIEYAAHSAQVEQAGEEMAAACAGITPLPAQVPFYSTVTGTVLDTTELDAAYWYRNLRQTVLFEQATRSLLTDGYRVFIEVSPHPVVTVGIGETLEDAGIAAVVTGTLRRDEGGMERFLRSLTQVWASGGHVAWDRFWAAGTTAPVPLPTYAFQNQRYWLTAAAQDEQSAADPAESGFWSAVERGDLGGLSGVLGLADEPVDSALAGLLPRLSSWRRRRQA